MTLRDKTITGLTWSFADNFASQGINLIIGIILARLLTPNEFGLIGMIGIFIALSQSFIDSGFSQALIRKKDCTQEDYSTVFFYNLFTGILFYLILFLSADTISNFFNEPQLRILVQVLGLSIIINSFSVIQHTILVKRVDFKLQTRISIIASGISGLIAVAGALAGYGVWSLVIRTLLGYLITSFLLWIWNKWKPSIVFNTTSFRELFSFGSKLLFSGLIDTTFRNIYYLVIGKYFSTVELGYFTRAQDFVDFPSRNINGVISRVSYPVLASIQDDKKLLKRAYKKLITSTMLITFISMSFLAAAAEPIVITSIGEQWRPAIIYLQMMCFVGAFYPLHALNLNMLKVLGRSDLFLRLEIIKKIFVIPVIIVGILFGIKAMIAGMMFYTLIAYYINSFWSGKYLKYSIFEQIKDILPLLILSLVIGFAVYIISLLVFVSYLKVLVIQLIAGTLITILALELTKFNSYLDMKSILFAKIGKKVEF